MTNPIVFSADEIAVARARQAKMQASAQSWNRYRWILMLIAFFAFSTSYLLFHSARSALLSIDDTVMEAMKDKTPVEGYTRDMWYIAELRRSIVIMLNAHSTNSICVVEFVASLLNFGMGTLLAIMVFNRWNMGPWYAVEAKLLQWQIEQCSGASSPQGETAFAVSQTPPPPA